MFKFFSDIYSVISIIKYNQKSSSGLSLSKYPQHHFKVESCTSPSTEHDSAQFDHRTTRKPEPTHRMRSMPASKRSPRAHRTSSPIETSTEGEKRASQSRSSGSIRVAYTKNIMRRRRSIVSFEAMGIKRNRCLLKVSTNGSHPPTQHMWRMLTRPTTTPY